jgi:hypothetical protein
MYISQQRNLKKKIYISYKRERRNVNAKGVTVYDEQFH